MDWLAKIKGTLDKVWGSLNGQTQAAEPLPVTARAPTPEEEKQFHQDPGQFINPTPAPGDVLGAQTYAPATEQGMVNGLTKWGGGTAPPIATEAAALVLLGNLLNNINPKINPYLPGALSLKEGGGGTTNPQEGPGLNNSYGLMSFPETGGRELASYPSYTVATLGGGNWGPNGGPQQGLKGTLTGGLYNDFLQSGDLADYFRKYTPPGQEGNDTLEGQINTLNTLLQLFSQ